MPPRRVTGVLVSTAVASSLLLSSAPANADDSTASSTFASTVASNSEVESAVPAPEVAEDSADVSSTSEPSESAAQSPEAVVEIEPKDVQAADPTDTPVSTEKDENSIEPTLTPKSEEPSSSPSQVAVESGHPSDSAGVQSSSSSKTDSDSADPSETSSTEVPFGYSDGELTPEQEEILKKIDELEPKGSEDWTEEQWDVFYETPEGKAYDELWSDFFDSLPDWEESISDEEKAFWEKIDQMIPEGSEDWTDQQWLDFYETPEGQEIERLINEFNEDLYGDDAGISEEEEAFFEELNRRMPQGSEDWSEKQWADYLSTDAGHELLEFYLGFEFDHAESPEDLAELIEMYREFFDDGSGWYDAFVDLYLNGPEAGVTDPPSESATATDPAQPSKPVSIKKPKVSPEIVPAAKVIKSASERAQVAAHPMAKKVQDSKKLADTGFNSLWIAAGGVLLAGFGALFARRARRNPAKH